MQPMPATTQSCLAMMVAVARRAGSMVSAVVMSLAALSSSRAASRRVVMRRDFQSMEGMLNRGVAASQQVIGSASQRLVGK